MIVEEDLAESSLAGKEPRLQFRFIEQLAAKRLAERDFGGEPLYDNYDYMSTVLEAATVFGIRELTEWDMPLRSGDDWQWRCRNFRAEASRISQRILFEYASQPAKDPNSVALNAATKERLRFHLGQVRGIVDGESIPEWKKRELYEAIAELEREIDKARTRIAAIFDVVGQMWSGDVNVAEAMRNIVIIIQDAKAVEKETAKLTSPIEPKQLAPPRATKTKSQKQQPKRSGFGSGADEEVPF